MFCHRTHTQPPHNIAHINIKRILNLFLCLPYTFCASNNAYSFYYRSVRYRDGNPRFWYGVVSKVKKKSCIYPKRTWDAWTGWKDVIAFAIFIRALFKMNLAWKNREWQYLCDFFAYLHFFYMKMNDFVSWCIVELSVFFGSFFI